MSTTIDRIATTGLLSLARPPLGSGAAPAAATARAADRVQLSGSPAAASAPAPRMSPVALASSLALAPAASGVGSAIGHALAGWAAGVHFISFGMIYKLEHFITAIKEKIHRPLDTLPTPRIDTPFVIVPGWTTEPEAFSELVDHLTRNNANGGQPYYVRQGQIFTLDSNGDLQLAAAVPPDARVFEMVFSDNRQSPDKNVVEMRANFDAIQQATGHGKFDVEGYSMGGIDSRLYVDQGGDAINRLLLLGTPNRGTHFADLAKNVLDRHVGWAARFGALQNGDVGALTWLQPEDVSQPLADLNSRWTAQRQKVTTLTVGTDVMPTPAEHGLTGITWGDGLVPSTSLEMPISNTIVLHNAMQHGRLNDDETVEHIRAVYFGWGLPAHATNDFPRDDHEILKHVPRPTHPASHPAPRVP